jgi:hypothetical protein
LQVAAQHRVGEGGVVDGDVIDFGERQTAPARHQRAACQGKRASNFLRVKRSSCAAATISPSRTSAAALSWRYDEMPRILTPIPPNSRTPAWGPAVGTACGSGEHIAACDEK